MGSFLQFVGAIAWIIISPAWWGLTLRILWGWFVVPIFDVPTLSIAQAIGVQTVVGFATHHYSGTDERGTAEKLAVAIVTPLVFLVFGYIVHLFV